MGFMRPIRTTQELRANQDGFGRAKRSKHNLPSLYDDISPCIQRSWKKYRDTQYKTKASA